MTDHFQDELNQEYLITATNIQATAPDISRPEGEAVAVFRFKEVLGFSHPRYPFRTLRQTPRPSDAGPANLRSSWVLKEKKSGPIRSVGSRSSLPGTPLVHGTTQVPVGSESPSRGRGKVGARCRFREWAKRSSWDSWMATLIVPSSPDASTTAIECRQRPLPMRNPKTVLRTRSTKDGDVECFHELTFDDAKDAELIYLHSERDFQRVVENNDFAKSRFRKTRIGRSDRRNLQRPKRCDRRGKRNREIRPSRSGWIDRPPSMAGTTPC